MFKSIMVSVKQSPINRTYLIGISTPQAVEQEIRKLVRVLEQDGIISSPLPGLIPVAEFSTPPKVPVPGLLPVSRTPLALAENLDVDSESGWVYWPVDSGGWLGELTANFSAQGSEKEAGDPDLFPMRSGIPLARIEDGGEESILSSPEVSKILKNPPGWRALNLVCWSVEWIQGRPWYLSALWYSPWQRRLKRAPKGTNINK